MIKHIPRDYNLSIKEQKKIYEDKGWEYIYTTGGVMIFLVMEGDENNGK